MTEQSGDDADQAEHGRDALPERRRYERRSGVERRGSLRWDPRAPEKERRSGNDRRRREDHARQ